MAFNTKDLSKDLAKHTTSIVVSAVTSGGVNPTAVVQAILDVGGLCWKAGVYIHHKSNVQKSLALCLEEYRAVGYLTASMTDGDAQLTMWQTTPKFHEARIVLHAYPDIDQFLKEENFTQAELKWLGLDSELTIHADKAASKRLGDLNARISACCLRTGIKDLTKTDAEKRIANVSAMQMGAIILQNAFIAEGQRRERGEVAAVVPVLGRILGIMAICGITDIALSEIATLLGKAPIYETIARARIAKLRNAHASQVFNTLLFSGNTESIAKGFGNSAINFSGERLVVGRVKAPKKSEFLAEYATFNCELSGPPDRKHAVDTPIYLVAGWANLIKQRESFEKQHSGFAQMVHMHVPVKATDCHGNTYMSAGKLPKIVFKVKELPDGTLMAKPRNFDRFDYKSGANYDRGRNRSKASGEEKLFGGIVGPPVCKCRGTPDINKGQLINSWKLGSGIKISSRDFVGNSIVHTQQLSTKKIAILWRPGDWIMGAFLMQILPQSSYLQGRAECLHCAVENAALYGCAEVIACGGGKVSAEALENEVSKPEPAGVVVAPEAPTFRHEKPEEELAETPLLLDPMKKCLLPLPLERAKAETATALYDYEAQAAGDLSFSKGDVIEIMNRTQNETGWWTGITNGKQGLFPGNYVRLDPDTTYPPISPDSSSSPALTRMLSTDSTPSSPPPAYGSMSPGPPPAGAEYFAISDARGDKIVPLVVRRKPVGSGVVRKPLAASSAVSDAKIPIHAMEAEVNPWLVEPDAANRR